MDYSIAIIVPSTEVSETAQAALSSMDLDYPVIAASSEKAVEEAQKLLPMGLRLIISHGITYKYLQKSINLPILELPFGGLDVMVTVQQALKTGGRIVHMGTRPFYKFIERSLESLGEKKNRIYFHELNMEQTIDEQVLVMLDYGFNVFIGGYPVVETARRAGKTGLEFNVSSEIIKTTLTNARNMVQMLVRQEENTAMDRAILQASSDGILVVDPSGVITYINPSALHILHASADEVLGTKLQAAFQHFHIIDIEDSSETSRIPEEEHTHVLLKKVPIMLNSRAKGTVVSIKKISDIQELEYKVRSDLIVKGLVAKKHFKDIIGVSQVIKDTKEKAYTYAKYDSTVLIYGETGCGKELFAQSIHNASQRHSQPFVAINCAALPENLIESELFGYAKGAFTGANMKGKQGLFEMADHGTIFLDEISELPIPIQSKLLRVLQEGDIIRVGGDKVIHVDIRVICSSNKDLRKLIQEGKFKNDLYYRLSTLEINIPPLRERASDIEYLARELVHEYAEKHHKNIEGITPEVLEALSAMPFYGNVRELGNLAERMVILTNTPMIGMETLKKCDYHKEEVQTGSKTIRNAEIDMLYEALEKCGGNKTAAAQMLGINPSTLWRKLKKYEKMQSLNQA